MFYFLNTKQQPVDLEAILSQKCTKGDLSYKKLSDHSFRLIFDYSARRETYVIHAKQIEFYSSRHDDWRQHFAIQHMDGHQEYVLIEEISNWFDEKMRVRGERQFSLS